MICACSEEGVLSSVAAVDADAAVTEMAEEEESPGDGDCDEDDTTWPRRKADLLNRGRLEAVIHYHLVLFWLRSKMSGRGPFTNDVSYIFEIFNPLPPLSAFLANL